MKIWPDDLIFKELQKELQHLWINKHSFKKIISIDIVKCFDSEYFTDENKETSN